MQSTCKDIKNIPNPVLFIKIIFLLALKILKTSIFCNIFCFCFFIFTKIFFYFYHFFLKFFNLKEKPPIP